MTRPPLEETVQRKIPVLYRVAKRLARTAADAEDLVAKTLVQVVTHWNRFDGAFPRSWMIRILRNEHLQDARRRKAQPTVQMTEVSEPAMDDFWKDVDWTLVGGQLGDALDAIPEEFRLPIVLCDVEELTYEEAAAALDCPVGTIRSRIFRGRKLLRAKLYHLTQEATGA